MCAHICPRVNSLSLNIMLTTYYHTHVCVTSQWLSPGSILHIHMLLFRAGYKLDVFEQGGLSLYTCTLYVSVYIYIYVRTCIHVCWEIAISVTYVHYACLPLQTLMSAVRGQTTVHRTVPTLSAASSAPAMRGTWMKAAD